MLHKVLMADAQVKLDNAGSGSLTFYASTFANYDRVRPIPEKPTKGAFSSHLADFIKDGFIAYAHEWGSLPVATVSDAREDSYGVLVTADFHSTVAAQAVRTTLMERLSRGKSVKTSIGYEVLADEYVEMDDPTLQAQGITKGRLLTDVNLFEVSIVNVPANPLADVQRVKSLSPNPRVAPLLTAFKDLMDGEAMPGADAADILQCLLSYVVQGQMLAAAPPAVLMITAALLRDAQTVVTDLLVAPADPTQTAGKGTPLRRVPFAVEGDTVLRAASLFVARAQSRQAAYSRKEGRVLSSANRTKLNDLRPALRDILAIIDDLLSASEPKGAAPDLYPEVLRFLALEAAQLGVPV